MPIPIIYEKYLLIGCLQKKTTSLKTLKISLSQRTVYYVYYILQKLENNVTNDASFIFNSNEHGLTL